MPPPPGSRRAGPQRSLRAGCTRSTVVEISIDGFIVIVNR
jgi:hypothetical protein